MRRLLSAAAALFACALPTQASAVTLSLHNWPSYTFQMERPQPWQRWADTARVPAVPGKITFFRAPCPNGVNEACSTPFRETWIGPAYDPTLARQRAQALHILLHELGHHYDEQALTAADRQVFSALMYDRREWSALEPNPPAEKWADMYAFCGLSPRLQHRFRYWRNPFDHARGAVIRPQHGTKLDLRRARFICEWMRALG